ncbi:collagen alpha-2(I) chain-like [Mesoplodon densirostris]|uniref:collagen alpha-2(I) chain-like n=1 Tax=Mesoplodon densirostris TaxID=48708 RepID=UPI0028DCAB8F|nr:collagen alpha-2(I) chain-like [Mesoplodon densirostris]
MSCPYPLPPTDRQQSPPAAAKGGSLSRQTLGGECPRFSARLTGDPEPAWLAGAHPVQGYPPEISGMCQTREARSCCEADQVPGGRGEDMLRGRRGKGSNPTWKTPRLTRGPGGAQRSAGSSRRPLQGAGAPANLRTAVWPCWHPISFLTTCDTKARWFTHTRVNPGRARAARGCVLAPEAFLRQKGRGPSRRASATATISLHVSYLAFRCHSGICGPRLSPRNPDQRRGDSGQTSVPCCGHGLLLWPACQAPCPPSPSLPVGAKSPVNDNVKLQNEARSPHLGKPRAGLGNRICSAPPAPSRRLVATAGAAPSAPRSRAAARPPAGAGASLASRPRAPVREASVRAEEGGAKRECGAQGHGEGRGIHRRELRVPDPEPPRFSPGPRPLSFLAPSTPAPARTLPALTPNSLPLSPPTPPPLPPSIPSPDLEPPLPPPIPGSPRARRRGSQAAARTHPRPAAGLSAPGPVEAAGKAAPGRAWGERGDFGFGGPEGAPGNPRGSQGAGLGRARRFRFWRPGGGSRQPPREPGRTEARGKRASWVPARTRAGEDRDRVPRQDPIPGTDGVPRGVFYLHNTLRGPGASPAPSGIQLSAGAEGAEEVAKPSALTHAPGIPRGAAGLGDPSELGRPQPLGARGGRLPDGAGRAPSSSSPQGRRARCLQVLQPCRPARRRPHLTASASLVRIPAASVARSALPPTPTQPRDCQRLGVSFPNRVPPSGDTARTRPGPQGLHAGAEEEAFCDRSSQGRFLEEGARRGPLGAGRHS